MIKLYGQIAPVRLYGQINKVPSEGSGGPLQAKTAYPSHSEQVIAPDEDYHGLSVVVIKPVPRTPACVASLHTVFTFPNTLDHVVNIRAESSVEIVP